jgi:hypothetical protein
MQEPHKKGLANHLDLESCAGGREATGEALTGAHAGQPLSSVITSSGVPTLYGEGEGNMADGAKREPTANAAESETLSMRGNSSREKREIPRVPAGGAAGRPDKVHDRTSGMHARGKSDDRVVPEGATRFQRCRVPLIPLMRESDPVEGIGENPPHWARRLGVP